MFVKWKLTAHTPGQRMSVQNAVEDPSPFVDLGVHIM